MERPACAAATACLGRLCHGSALRSFSARRTRRPGGAIALIVWWTWRARTGVAILARGPAATGWTRPERGGAFAWLARWPIPARRPVSAIATEPTTIAAEAAAIAVAV